MEADQYTDIIAEAQRHRDESPMAVLLKKNATHGADPRCVAQQLEGLALAKVKWPFLAANHDIVYPPRLNCEQSSSEVAARYKATLVGQVGSLADLTGGMGIDSLLFASSATLVDYVEQDAQLVDMMRHNAAALGLDNVAVHCSDCVGWLGCSSRRYDWLYIDPSRRDSYGRRTVRLEDCQPDIVKLLPLLKGHCAKLLVKASPMADIEVSCASLASVEAVHVVAVNHECKELLFVVDMESCGETREHDTVCVDIWAGGVWADTFSHEERTGCRVDYADTVEKYLYEPHAALMKGGAYNSIGARYGLRKLSPNTHLYTSDHLVANFPGRVFSVLKELPFDRKGLRAEIPEGRCHVVTRNFPEEAATLQKRLGMAEGGTLFLVATTLSHRKTLLLCQRSILQ